MREGVTVGAEGASTPAADRLSIELLRRRLTTDVIGHHVYVFDTVDSTNQVLHTWPRAAPARAPRAQRGRPSPRPHTRGGGPMAKRILIRRTLGLW
jgi:hypothetical protein